MTGGARGYCNHAAGGLRGGALPGAGYGRGFGRGYGYGRGYGRGYYPAQAAPYYGAPGDEAAALKAEAEYLKGALDRINQRVTELEKKD